MNNEHNTKQIVVRLKDLYKDEKSTKYVLHLIHSFLPADKKTRPVQTFVDTNNNVVKCGITKVNLTDNDRLSQLSQMDAEGEMEGVQLAYSGVNTNNFISKDALQALEIFVESMLKANDRRITYVMSQIKAGK
jgi:hypothetical protein